MVHREVKGQTKVMIFHRAMLRYFSGRNEDTFAFYSFGKSASGQM